MMLPSALIFFVYFMMDSLTLQRLKKKTLKKSLSLNLKSVPVHVAVSNASGRTGLA